MKKEIKLGVLVAIVFVCMTSIGINASAAGNKRATVSSNSIAPTYPGMNQNIYYEYIPEYMTKNGVAFSSVDGVIGTAAICVNGIYYEYNVATNTYEPTGMIYFVPINDIGTAVKFENGKFYEYNPATNLFEEKELDSGSIGTAARVENGIYTEYNEKTNTWEKR